MGVATSFDASVEATCAAIRAGMSRPQVSQELVVLDSEEGDLAPALVHQVPGLTDGFFRLGRWMQLARGCFDDLVAARGAPAGWREPALWKDAALYLVVRRVGTEFLELEDEVDPIPYLRTKLLDPVCEALGLPIPPTRRHLISSGPAGLAEAISAATMQLDRGDTARALIIAVDSWLDPGLLAEAAEAFRLRSDENPSGFIPGEAGVALLLEPHAAVRGHGASAGAGSSLGRVELAIVGRAAANPVAEPAACGLELADAIGAAMARLPAGSVGDLFIDLSGEEWRARQWGAALVRLGQRLMEVRIHVPCVSVGDIGAASGALSVCLALQSFRRRWARRSHSLVVSASDTGEIGCVLVAGAAS
jgi:3-oxoacyl-[acyl-carrier-protein] synthase-1